MAEGDALTLAEALERLEVFDYDQGDGPVPSVHTFVQGAFGFLGAHWTLEAVRESVERGSELREAGIYAAALRHGIVLREGARAVFLGTKP